MGIIRIYKKFFCVSTKVTPNNYILITPTTLRAASFVSGINGEESSSVIENSIPLVEEETGIFYANLTPELYAEDVTYDLVFYVQYTPEAPLNKRLPVRFRIKAKNIVSNFDFELGDTSRVIEIEGNNSFGIEIGGDEMDIELSYQQVEHYVNNESNNNYEIN